MKRQFLFKLLCVWLWVGQGKNVMGRVPVKSWDNDCIHPMAELSFGRYFLYVPSSKQFLNLFHSLFYNGWSEFIILSVRKKAKVKQLLIGKSPLKWVIVKCFRLFCCCKDKLHLEKLSPEFQGTLASEDVFFSWGKK